VRTAALAALGGCAGAKALPDLKQALASKSPRQRVAALDGLAELPRVTEATRLIENALKEVEPEVLAAAVRAVAAQHLTGRSTEVAALLEHRSVEVRLACAGR